MVATSPGVREQPQADGAIVTKAALRAAERLNVPQRTLARVLGVSEASVSRMAAGTVTLAPSEKAYELALLFVRVFRSLDAMVGGEEPVARAWMRNANTVLGGTPIALIQTVTGLMSVVSYLDARRARV